MGKGASFTFSSPNGASGEVERAAEMLRVGPTASQLPGLLQSLKGFVAGASVEAAAYAELEERLGESLSAALERAHSGTAECSLSRWLYEWYQSGEPGAQGFVVAFAPVLVWSYLKRAFGGSDVAGFEACLLLIYNDTLAAAAAADTPPLTMPRLADGVADVPATPLPAIAVSPDTDGPLRADARMEVAAAVMQRAVRQLPTASTRMPLQFCAVCVGLATTGYSWAKPLQSNLLAGVAAPAAPFPLSVKATQALARGLGLCIHSSDAAVAAASRHAVAALQKRVTYDVMEEGMLLTSALQRELSTKASDQEV